MQTFQAFCHETSGSKSNQKIIKSPAKTALSVYFKELLNEDNNDPELLQRVITDDEN